MEVRFSLAAAVAVACVLALASGPAGAQTRLAKTDVEIRTLSTHPDTVSGGDVLVLIKMAGRPGVQSVGGPALERVKNCGLLPQHAEHAENS